MTTIGALQLLYGRSIKTYRLEIHARDGDDFGFKGVELMLMTDPMLFEIITDVTRSRVTGLVVSELEYNYLSWYVNTRKVPKPSSFHYDSSLVRYYTQDLEYMLSPGMARLKVRMKSKQLFDKVMYPFMFNEGEDKEYRDKTLAPLVNVTRQQIRDAGILYVVA